MSGGMRSSNMGNGRGSGMGSINDTGSSSSSRDRGALPRTPPRGGRSRGQPLETPHLHNNLDTIIAESDTRH
eukprot:SAG31_NODE_8311_length_1476_cov_1.790123_3_plen_72_part_00